MEIMTNVGTGEVIHSGSIGARWRLSVSLPHPDV